MHAAILHYCCNHARASCMSSLAMSTAAEAEFEDMDLQAALCLDILCGVKDAGATSGGPAAGAATPVRIPQLN